MATNKSRAATDPRKAASAATTEHNQSVKQAADEETPVRPRSRVKDNDEMVTVLIPHPFKLHNPPGVITPYDSGTQEMPRSHAEHPYSVDNGVTIYKAGK